MANEDERIIVIDKNGKSIISPVELDVDDITAVDHFGQIYSCDEDEVEWRRRQKCEKCGYILIEVVVRDSQGDY